MQNTQKEWLELSLIINNEEDIEHIESALEQSGAIAITYQAADDEEIFEPPIGTTPLWQNNKITALYPMGSDREHILQQLGQTLGDNYPINSHLLQDKDWNNAWLAHFQPIAISEKFWIASEAHQINAKDATILRINPGLAFGTGTHPSTALCLEHLVRHIPIKNKTLYDYGCGSGILGIAAALLGASAVYQTDIDPQALLSSQENATKNNVGDKITILSDSTQAPKVDILIANILLAPLCQLKENFERHKKAHTEFYFAGLLNTQIDTLRTHYHDYHIEQIAERENWVLLKLTTPHA